MGIVIKNNSLNNNGGIAINNNNVEGISYQNKTIYKKEEQANIEIVDMTSYQTQFNTYPGIMSLYYKVYLIETYSIDQSRRIVCNTTETGKTTPPFWFSTFGEPDYRYHWLISNKNLDNNKNYLANLDNYHTDDVADIYDSTDPMYVYIIPDMNNSSITRVYKNIFTYKP